MEGDLRLREKEFPRDEGDLFRPFLEQACRETFQELARIATQSDAAGSQSIDCVVRQVSERLLREAGESSLSRGEPASPRSVSRIPSMPGSPACEQPPVPLLRDLVAVPWVLWREKKRITGLIPAGFGRQPTTTTSDTESSSDEEVGVWHRQITSASFTGEDDGEFCSPFEPPCRSSSTVVTEHEASEENCEPRVRLSKKFASSGNLLATSKASALASRRRTASQESMLKTSSPKPTICRRGLIVETNTMDALQMQWQGRPRTCLIVIKQRDDFVQATMFDMARFLSSQGIIVVLEPQLLRDHPNVKKTLHGVRTFSEADRLENSIDLVITIGGDGTLTWAVSLFRGGMPPVLAFAAGSLGFLTPFPLDSWIRTLTSLLDLHNERVPQRLVCRMRLTVGVRRHDSTQTSNMHTIQCLNEILVHRGASSSLVKLNVGIDGENVTLVQGDGLILATPTGSTAYSLAAGGSMVHPSVPGILMTPVSPHSLSFRPALLPDSSVVTVTVPLNARCGAAVSVDGKDLCVLKLGDAVEVSMSSFPVPTICHRTETEDWFSSVQSGLQWNTRMEQKAH